MILPSLGNYIGYLLGFKEVIILRPTSRYYLMILEVHRNGVKHILSSRMWVKVDCFSYLVLGWWSKTVMEVSDYWNVTIVEIKDRINKQ